jgi:alkanesulfonate monooxygenase SsuD/methylene tetrahydromethanopterin reductase-like flavin-dependent oxidoreductase (luciferase family)
MWIQEEARFEGSYYQVRGAINQPKGRQQPHIPLLIGGSGEQVTLKLVVQYADACNITNPDIATLERKLAILKKHCEAFGRDYESIKRTVLLMAAIAETDEQAALKIGSIERDAQGQADLDRIRERAGAQEIIVYIPDAATLESVQMFARTYMGT